MVLKDPENSENHIIRRLAAIEGFEMASTNEIDEMFVIEKDRCWVLSDNENLKPKVCHLHANMILMHMANWCASSYSLSLSLSSHIGLSYFLNNKCRLNNSFMIWLLRMQILANCN